MIGQNDGLPNITGQTYNLLATTEWEEGAVSNAHVAGNRDLGSGNTTKSRWLQLDASKGETKTDGTLKTSSEHKVYGTSNFVTPKNITIKLWKRIS